MLNQLAYLFLVVVDWFIKIFIMAVGWLYNLLMSAASGLR
jgi:hypothetical protein